MRKPFSTITVLLLVAVALIHALRIALGWPVFVADLPIPMLVSVLAIILCLVLAVGLAREMKSAPAEPTGDIDRWRKHERARPRDKPTPESAAPTAPVLVRQPAQYFLFSSDGITPQQIRVARERYERIMVGFDSGDIPAATLRAAKEAGAELEIYVEGPGGPTGDAWADDERRRIKAAAESVGIDTRQANWIREWDREGWKTYTFRQLEDYLRQGYTAGEIDNLDRVLGDTPEKTVTFFKEYASLHAQGRLPRLITKNLSEDKLARLVRAIEMKELPRAMFSEFHISEKGSGNRKKQDELSSRIAIRTLASNDTHHYDAKGAYGLDEVFIALLGGEQGPAVAARDPQASTA